MARIDNILMALGAATGSALHYGYIEVAAFGFIAFLLVLGVNSRKA